MNKSPHEIILRPVLTEKSALMRDELNQVCFVVQHNANKIEIKQAVETLFEVNVTSVRTQIMRGKVKRYGRGFGKRPNWKKAIVTLGEGSHIEFFEAS
ncbi:MAG: 50S ribosomal protein L23 [Deltaproteobacteria bacterium]|nr:MAG: 50S ribosomal protein L23 [Deltaproteobacteria bacterium]